MAQTLYTDLVTLVSASWLNDVDAGTYNKLSAVAGTNTITATGPTTVTVYAANQWFIFTPAATNTGATTLNISAIGAKSVFKSGTACVGGELRISVPVIVQYDGTQFNIIGPFFGPTSGTKQASTSGTSITFTGIPAWAKRITIQLVGVSTNGTSNLLVQIGPSGGVETTGYLGAASSISASTGSANYTTGFGLTNGVAATYMMHGEVTLSLQDAASFTWTCTGLISRSEAAEVHVSSGSKSTASAIDRVRITMVNGTDAFDAGSINILYE